MRTLTILFVLSLVPAIPAADPKPFPGKVSRWEGFVRHDFTVDGNNVIVVEPARPLPGRPWAWRGEFFGAFANADVALVKAGWHLVYVATPDLFGSPKAMARWEKVYAILVRDHQLHARPGLIGLSRGALYCMAWAAAHPDRTLAVYLDNGVCDFKSWPGGKPKGLGTGPGSEAEWRKLLQAYNFKDDKEAIASKANPVDNLAPLAQAKVPLLLVYGDSDKVVPHRENSERVFERYRALGGPVERVVKKGADHHPHGMTDPAPIVAFFERARARPSASLEGRRPNIIFVLTDDQGYGDLSCHGNPILKTPNLDRLHDEGVRFTDFHVSPTCSPTRSALMTGRHEFKNGVTHTILERERLTLKATTIAQVLKSAGYTTGIFGKWHLGDEPNRWPDKRGFDEMFIHGCGGIGQSYPGSCGDVPGNTYFNPILLHNGRLEKTRGYCTDVFFGQALRWIESVKGKQPFFCYLPTNAPHAPLQVRPEDEKRYADRVKDRSTAKFFGMIANIDDNVGRLLDKLKEWGIERDTLVIFMNDNGGTAGVRVYNAGMRGAKVTPWLGGTRAASFWRWPGTLKPGDVDRLAAHIDFFPTVAELAGARLTEEAKTQVEGRSLVPLLRNPEAAWPERILFTHVGRWPKGAQPAKYKFAHCSVRSPRWHLVCDTPDGSKQWQLFEVKADPGEKTNVAARHPVVVTELSAAYDRWWDSVQSYLVNEDAVGPKVNPFKELFEKQLGSTPK